MRILLVSPRPLRPVRRGHQLRALQVAGALGASGHEVTVLTPAGGAAPDAGSAAPFREVAVADPLARRLSGVVSAWLGGRPARVGVAAGPALERACERLAREADLVVVQLARLARLAERSSAGGVPWVADLVDSLALNLERRAARDRVWLRPLLRLEARRLLATERRMIAGAAASWLVSERDRAWLAERHPDLADRLVRVPLVVEPRSAAPASDVAGPPIACLTGNLGYFPTREGAEWLLREVWADVRARAPGVTLRVAGARPPASLARAVRRAGGELIADPPDLGALLAAASMALVPLRAGSGVPIKLLEAWSAGVPAIATPWAAAGADARAGEDHLAAESPREWAEAVARLASDAALGARLAAAGRRRLLAEHSVKSLHVALERSLAALSLRP